MDLNAWLANVESADWILNVGIQSTIILAVSLFLRRAGRRFSSPARSSICFMTMILLLVAPAASLMSSDFSLMKINVNQSSTLLETQKASPDDQQQAPSILKRIHTLSIYAVNLGGTIWLLGTLLMAVRLGYGLYYTRKMVSRLQRSKNESLVPVTGAVMELLGATRQPDIYTSTAVKSPQTVGLFAPCIVLPADLCEKTNEEELKSILLHEMSHIYHNDQWAGLLQRIISTVFWWNPLTYGLSSSFSQEREYVCDMYVSRHGNPRAFANCLLHLARDAQSLKCLPTALCAITSTGFLEKRIHKILTGGQIMKTRLGKKTFLVHVLFSIVLAGLLFSVNLTMANQPAADLQNEEISAGMEVDTPARILMPVPPIYPHEAKKNNIEGRVIVRFVVDAEGEVREPEIVVATPAGFFEASALDAIVQYEFAPAIKDGMPVNSLVTLPIAYGLDGLGLPGGGL
jgi:TonB family protein